MKQRIHVYDSVAALSRAAAASFAESATAVLAKQDELTVALSGGSTPKTLYSLLGTEYRDSLPWSRVHFFWTDERFVPPDQPESNYRMAHETLLRPLGVPPTNVHAPDTGASDAGETAQRYEQDIRTRLGSKLPRLDWVLLGMGEDGHVASLFPESAALDETRRLVVAVDDSPKPPPIRVTMTLPLLNAAREIHFLVAGASKQAAFSRILRRDDPNLPAQRVRPNAGSVDWWVDSDAAMGVG